MNTVRGALEASLRGKRIVFVLAGEVLGGAERGALDLAHELREREGAEVMICALDDRKGPARRLAEERGISWTCVRTHWVAGGLRKAASLARFTHAVRRLRPDVLIASTNGPNVVCGLTWRATGAALAVWTQCDVNGTTRFSRGLLRRALRSTPIVVTRAHHGRDWLVDELDADPRRIHVLRSPVLLAAPRESGAALRALLGLGEDDLVACMLAHLHSGKDHETLLRTWRLVVDRLAGSGPRPVLLLAGRDAGNEAAVKALAFDLDLRDHARFLGEVADVSGVLEASDLAAFCSHRELFPRGVTEPMAAGLPVAGTDVPGTREAMGEPGAPFLAPAGDAAALAEVILRLARDPELRVRLGLANAELIRSRQALEVTTGAYARLLSDALASRF